jgi:hypothetical protein
MPIQRAACPTKRSSGQDTICVVMTINLVLGNEAVLRAKL